MIGQIEEMGEDLEVSGQVEMGPKFGNREEKKQRNYDKVQDRIIEGDGEDGDDLSKSKSELETYEGRLKDETKSRKHE